MRDYYGNLNKRAVMLAKYIIKTKCTVRSAATVFGVSKSTVHNDVSNKLKNINYMLYKKVSKVLENNFNQKHIRGGEATRLKYKK